MIKCNSCFSSSRLWGAFNVLVFNIIVFLMSASHLRAVFSDPGIVPLPKANLDFSDMHSGQKQKDKVRQPNNKFFMSADLSVS